MQKFSVFTLFILVANSAFAAPIATQYCNKMVELSYQDVKLSTQERLELAIGGFDEAYSMNLNEDQKQKFKSALEKILEINPDKINDFEKSASAPCFLDMSPEERAEAGQTLKSQLGL